MELVAEKYQQTEVGLIPSDWEVKWLGEIATCYSGGTPNTSVREYYNGNINWISSSELNKGRIFETNEFISELGLNNSSAKMVPTETFLLAMYGATAGVSAITYIEGAINQAVLAIIPKEINSEYLFQYFRLNKEKIIKTYTQGGQPNLSGSIIKSISIPLPPTKVEQTAIANALSDTDDLISSLEKLIAKKRNIKQGVMQKLLQPKEGWEVKKLGEIAEVRDGTHQTPKYVEAGIPFYSVETVTNNSFSNTKFISEEEHKLLTKSFRIEKGDILMTRIGSIGDCKLIDWEVNASFYVSLALLKIKAGFSSNYICHYSKTEKFKKEADINSLQSAIPRKINLGPISNIKIELPDFEEQTRIANILSDMDAEITALETKLEKYKKVKLGMMQNLLTGKIRLV